MQDFESRYTALRASGLEAWQGSDYSRSSKRLLEAIDWLAKYLLEPPARALELGCGNGTGVTKIMANRGFHVYGIDISPTAIDWAEENFARQALRGEFQVGNVCCMPFDQSSFDIVYDGSCTHCLVGDDRHRCFSEVRRVLRPGGTFVLSSMCGTPKSADAISQYDPRSRQLYENGRPIRTLKPLAELEHEMKVAGFTPIDHRVQLNSWWDHLTLVCV